MTAEPGQNLVNQPISLLFQDTQWSQGEASTGNSPDVSMDDTHNEPPATSPQNYNISEPSILSLPVSTATSNIPDAPEVPSISDQHLHGLHDGQDVPPSDSSLVYSIWGSWDEPPNLSPLVHHSQQLLSPVLSDMSGLYIDSQAPSHFMWSNSLTLHTTSHNKCAESQPPSCFSINSRNWPSSLLTSASGHSASRRCQLSHGPKASSLQSSTPSSLSYTTSPSTPLSPSKHFFYETFGEESATLSSVALSLKDKKTDKKIAEWKAKRAKYKSLEQESQCLRGVKRLYSFT